MSKINIIHQNPVIQALLNRQSSGLLTDPAPSGEQLEWIFESALTAPDHARLQPWRYLVIQDEGRDKLGELFIKAVTQIKEQLAVEEYQKLKRMPYRSPMIIVAIAKHIEHPKVPAIEQIMSASVGVGQMLVALQSLGFGGYWRTGDLTYDQVVKAGLGIAEQETLLGFLYVGTPQKEAKARKKVNVNDFFTRWPSS